VTFLLDTNVISELRKPASRADQAVRRWAENQRPESLFLSVNQRDGDDASAYLRTLLAKRQLDDDATSIALNFVGILRRTVHAVPEAA
jgi:predicted nucleic acid-binding protein